MVKCLRKVSLGKAKKQYNLCSHKGTSIPVPVELQVSDDNRFFNSVLENSILSQ